MAQYFEDFNAKALGGQPAGWTRQGTDPDSATYTVVEDGPGRSVEHSSTSNLARFRFLAWDEVDSDPARGDAEILVKVNILASAGVRVPTRWTTGGDNYYGGRLTPSSVDIITPGSIAASTGKSVSSADDWWLRFRVNGSTLQVRAWQDGTTEPGAWDLQVTNTELTAPGPVGFGTRHGDSGTTFARVKQIGVGTGGDVAPSEAGGATGTEGALLGPNGRPLRGPSGGLLRLA